MLLYNHLWHNILHLPTNLQEKLRHNVFKGFAQRGDLFSHKDEPELFPHRILFWKAQNICSMGGISLDFMSDRPLGNLILSFLVISLWKTTTILSLLIFLCKKKNSLCKPPHSETTNSAILPKVSTACITGTSILQAGGASSFTPSRNLFRTSQDRRGHGRIWLSHGSRLFCTLCLSGHVPVKVQASPKWEDYLSFVHVALQKPLDINVSWLASVRPGLEHSAVRVFVFVELSWTFAAGFKQLLRGSSGEKEDHEYSGEATRMNSR